MPTAKVNDINLYYEVVGPPGALPIVCVAGWTASGALLFEDLAAALSSRYRVLSLDMRGHGQSDKPPSGEYTLEALSTDIHGLLLALNVRQPVALLGQSMGGMIVLDFALRYPENVAKLIIANSKAQLMGSFKDRLLWEMFILMYRLSPAKFFGGMIPNFFHQTPAPEVTQRLLDMSLQTPKHIGINVIRSTAHVDLSDEIRGIQTPTLVFTTEFDQPDIRVGTEAIAAAIPNARLEVIPESAHLPFIEQQELFVEKVTDFLG